jgi:hypothetical protein
VHVVEVLMEGCGWSTDRAKQLLQWLPPRAAQTARHGSDEARPESE